MQMKHADQSSFDQESYHPQREETLDVKTDQTPQRSGIVVTTKSYTVMWDIYNPHNIQYLIFLRSMETNPVFKDCHVFVELTELQYLALKGWLHENNIMQ